jgi:DNA-binding beta-propeller fold protein YncE
MAHRRYRRPAWPHRIVALIMAAGLFGCATLSIQETTNGSVISIPVPSSPNSILVSHDNREAFVSYGTNNRITIVDLVSHKVLKTLRMEGDVSDMALSPDGRSLYVTMTYGTNTTFDMEVVHTGTDSASTLLALGGSAQTVSVSPTGRYAYVTFGTGTGTTGEALATIDLAHRSILSSMPVPDAPDTSALTPNGRYLYMTTDPYTTGTPSGQASFNGQLVVVDITHHHVVATVNDGQDLACGLAVAPDGHEVLESFCSSEGTQVPPLPIRVYSTGTNALLATIPTQNGAAGLAFSDDGRVVYAATSEDTIDVINPRSHRVTGSISVPKQSAIQTLDALAMSPDGSLLCVGTQHFHPLRCWSSRCPRDPAGEVGTPGHCPGIGLVVKGSGP